MDSVVNIMEIAEYCKNEYEQKCERTDGMTGYTIHYVAITDEGKIKISRTPHILSGAQQCYLIHCWQQIAVTWWYATYEIQSINVDGEVGRGEFDEEYSFSIMNAGFNSVEEIIFKKNGNTLYSARLFKSGCFLLARELQFIWELYKKCKKECNTLFESQLMCKMASREETIKDLEERLADSSLKEQYLRNEIREYRNLLSEIRSTLQSIDLK